MGISGAIACSFFDPDTGEVVQINEITQESSFTLNDIFETDLDSSRVKVAEEFFLQIGTYQAEGIEQLKKWSRDKTKLQFVLAGRQQNILIYRSSTITIDQPYNFRVRGRNKTIITMSGEEERLPVWQGMNLMHGFVLTQGFHYGWADTDDDGLPDGYNSISVATLSFSNDEFSITKETTGQSVLTIIPIFPISGIELTLSSLWTKLHSTIFNSLQLSGLDYNGSFAFSAGTINVESTGRHTIKAVTGSGTWVLRPYALRLSGGTGTSDSAKIKYPALRTDGLSIYTE